MLYCLEWNKVKLCTHKRKNSTTLGIGGTANFSMRVTNLSGYPKRASRRYCAHGGSVLLRDIIRRVCNKISMVSRKGKKNEKKNTDSACASRRYREDPWCSMHDARASRRAVKLARLYIRSGAAVVTVIAPTFHAKERINYRETRALTSTCIHNAYAQFAKVSERTTTRLRIFKMRTDCEDTFVARKKYLTSSFK